MAYLATGGKNLDRILYPALAFELFHNYTLVHDDIYDEDAMRRNVRTIHTEFERYATKMRARQRQIALLYRTSKIRFGVVSGFIAGKMLHNLGARIILQSPITNKQKLEGLNLLQKVSLYDNTGQAIDLFFENKRAISVRDYLLMVRHKTGQLFKASVEWGCVLSGAAKQQRKALSKYAEEVAYVFQIKDDFLDLGLGGKKGRLVGSDIKKGKKTLPLMLGFARLKKREQKLARRLFGDSSASQENIQRVIAAIRETDGVKRCEYLAHQKIRSALSHLHSARPVLREKPRKTLERLTYFMWERQK